jgi:hypothetical protein
MTERVKRLLVLYAQMRDFNAMRRLSVEGAKAFFDELDELRDGLSADEREELSRRQA